MSDSPYLPPSRLEEHRERLIAELSEHFAHDNLDTEEFERRLDRAYQATSLADLQSLKADLPAVARPAPLPAPASGVELAPEGEVQDRQIVFALMGGSERKGSWTPARNIDAFVLMGGIELDFREARFAPGVTVINALAIMGGIEIIVPPGIRVETSGIGIMGGFESLNQTAEPGAPTLRITGAAIMGGVEVSQRLPGEKAKEARRRLGNQHRLHGKRHTRRLGQGE